MSRRIINLSGSRLVDIRIFKKSEIELEFQYIAYGPIDFSLRHFAFLDKFFKVLNEAIRHHVHVDACVD